MKFFIYLCCIAHLLTVISARLRLTTPMPSAQEDAASLTSNIAEIIDFVNSVYKNDGRSIAQSGRYDLMLRRFILPEVKSINLPPSVVVPNDEDTQNQLENLADTVRYQVIDNPEVLEEYSNKQKQKNNEEPLKPVSVDSDTSTEAQSFSTSDKKLRYYHSKSNSTATHTSTNNNKFEEFLHTSNPKPLDIVLELTTVGSTTYQPSFPDGDDDDDIQVSATEEGISTPRADANNHANDLKINNTVEVETRTLDNKPSGKEDQAGMKEEKAPMDDTKETIQMKNELPIKKDNNNDDDGVTVGVTVNEEKSGGNKEYISSKLDYNTNTNERPSEDNVRPRDEYYKNNGKKNTNVTTHTTSEKDNKPKVRSLEKIKVITVPVERLMGRIFKSALRNKQQKNNYYSKEHSIYAHKERNENNNKQLENRHEKRDKYDRKKKDKQKYNRWSKTEKNWNKIDKQRYKKDSGYDRMEYEWNKRHQQYDEKDYWNKNGNQWDKNDEFGSRDRDSNKRDNDWDKRDNDWIKSGNDWKKRDFDSNKRDNDWNERDIDSNKRVNDWNNRDIDSNKRESVWNKRDNDWNKRDIDSNKRDNDWNNRDIDSDKKDIDSNKRDHNWNKRDREWIKQDSKTYKDDRNKNDMDSKQNEWENKYLQHTTVVIDGGKANERYEIIERNIKDGDKRHFKI